MRFEDVTRGTALRAAPLLVGWTLLHEGVGGRIVEVEAYEPDDEASHSFRGETARNRTMFGPAGALYVYRSHGLHWCANITCGPAGTGAAVLLRALEPTHGLEEMRSRRGGIADALLCAGPGRLAQALGLDGRHDGADPTAPPFELLPPTGTIEVVSSPRVGISRAVERPWRFVERGTSWSSRGRPRG